MDFSITPSTCREIELSPGFSREALPGPSLRANAGLQGRSAASMIAKHSAAPVNGHQAGDMLVLSRKRDEEIIIGDDIYLSVVQIGPRAVKIRTKAPGDISIRRGELPVMTHRSREASSSGGLVLDRRQGQLILIADNISVKVVDIRGDKVRLGIEAPREVSIHRQEVYDAIQREKEAELKESAEGQPEAI